MISQLITDKFLIYNFEMINLIIELKLFDKLVHKYKIT